MSHTIGRRTTVIAVAAAVLSLLSPAGRAHGAAPSEVRSQTLVIDQDDRSAFGIKEVRWVETSGTVPAHAYILGCHGCGSASYASSGELNDPSSLHRIPTSYVLRVPVNYNAKLVANIPPGASTHTFFRARHAQLLADGYAVAVMDHPMPGFPRFPYEQFFRPPYSTADSAEASLPPGICCEIS